MRQLVVSKNGNYGMKRVGVDGFYRRQVLYVIRYPVTLGTRSSSLYSTEKCFLLEFLSDFENLHRSRSLNVIFMCKCNICVEKNVPDWKNLIKDAEFPNIDNVQK